MGLAIHGDRLHGLHTGELLHRRLHVLLGIQGVGAGAALGTAATALARSTNLAHTGSRALALSFAHTLAGLLTLDGVAHILVESSYGSHGLHVGILRTGLSHVLLGEQGIRTGRTLDTGTLASLTAALALHQGHTSATRRGIHAGATAEQGTQALLDGRAHIAGIELLQSRRTTSTHDGGSALHHLLGRLALANLTSLTALASLTARLALTRHGASLTGGTSLAGGAARLAAGAAHLAAALGRRHLTTGG